MRSLLAILGSPFVLLLSACASSVVPSTPPMPSNPSSDASAIVDSASPRGCVRSSDCAAGEVCAVHAAGCSATGVCEQEYFCRRLLSEYCACDATTFRETCNGPDRPWLHVGPCAPTCPAVAIESTACSVEGQQCPGEMYGTGCGPMTETCTCASGTWRCVRYQCDPVDAGVPPPPPVDAGMNCGTATCDPATQFCQRVVGGVTLDEHDSCETYPDNCAADHSCACLARNGTCGANGTSGFCSETSGLVSTECDAK